MARPQETFNKKELEKKRLQKRKEKQQRKEERKANPNKGASLEDMMAYVDENGNITTTPPDQAKKRAVKADDIVLGSRNVGGGSQYGGVRQGKVTFFNTSKGFGFIKDSENGDSVFVHSKALSGPIQENDTVSFETERGFKGLNAINVKIIK